MITVFLVDPEGTEYRAELDETAGDLELRQDIISALKLEGAVDDYDIRLASGIKLSEGAKIKVKKRRSRKVKLIS